MKDINEAENIGNVCGTRVPEIPNRDFVGNITYLTTNDVNDLILPNIPHTLELGIVDIIIK